MSSELDKVRSGYYPIGNFDGAERYVRFDLNAFAEMERVYGSMEKANDALSSGSMTDVRRILWIGLIHDQANLDEVTGEPISYNLKMHDVGRWLTPQNMKTIMQKLNSAVTGATPEAKPESEAAAAFQLARQETQTEMASEEEVKEIPN